MTEGRRPRVVLDCMTYLQATASPGGPAAACLRLLDRGVFELFFSEDILREVTDVLSRPKLRQKNPLLTEERVQEFLEHVRRLGTRTDPVPIRFTYPRDPKDEPRSSRA
jgi:putative PIN family toxin of toxin-antitoxin system